MIGRPLGATNRPQFHVYTTEIERKEYVLWVKKNYKKKGNERLALWYGDQLFGKAMQTIGGEGGGPIQLEISEAVSKKNASNSKPK